VKHEPVGNNDNRCEDAKLADGLEVNTEPDKAEQREVGERGEGDGRADLTESDTDTDGHRVRERYGEDCFCLRVSQSARRPNSP
jgi:hypothetical protein